MKKLFTLALVLIAASAFAGGFMPKDSDQVKAPLFSPDGTTVTLLTVNSSTFDMTNYFMYAVVGTAATCKIRLMPTSAKGAYASWLTPATMSQPFAVNKNTPFLNLSGCTGGWRILQ